MKKVLLALSSILLLMTASCTKEIDDQDLDVSKPVYLQDSYWMLTSLIVDPDYGGDNSAPNETFPTLADCEKDNVFDFRTDTEYIVDESFLKCNANNPDQATYYYMITQNDSYIKIYSNPEDIDNSVLMQGEIETISIYKYTIKVLTYDENTELTEMKLYTYEASKQKPNK